MPLLTRRASLLGLASFTMVPGLALARPKGIKGRLEDARQQLMPGFAEGSHVHAYQSYAFIYSFANGNVVTHQRATRAIQGIGVGMLESLQAKGARAQLKVHTDPHDDGTQWYGLDLLVSKGRKTIRIPGTNPPDPTGWHKGVAESAALTGLPAADFEKGHSAWFDLVRVLNGLDTEAATLIGHSFALQVVAERTRNGELADWFGPRPAEQTLEDIAHAQSLIADDVDRVRGAQAAVLATITLANLYEKPGALDALKAELAAVSDDLAAWQASHRQPTPADFGVSYEMPSPEKVQEVIDDQLGVVGAAIDVARGAATGDLPRTLDGLARLAPKDTKVRTVAEGIAAASNGDIKGTLGAIAELGGPDTQVGRVAARLESVAGVLDKIPG